MLQVVEYFCKNCDVEFVVFHQSDIRNSHCDYCNHPVHETGITIIFENDDVVTRKNGMEVSRRKKSGGKT
jgi:DNA-directed RNA polymerase subunit RPC12/RpoP